MPTHTFLMISLVQIMSCSLPTYRSLRHPAYPIDNIGIQPDIFLDKAVKGWEKHAVGYLEH